MKHFIEAIIHDQPLVICTPESAADSVALVEAEEKSANAGGAWVSVDVMG
ncbi:hypothetical protein [Paenibacillus oralis]|nr:hypothetical protein [Paenibacillus oralis]